MPVNGIWMLALVIGATLTYIGYVKKNPPQPQIFECIKCGKKLTKHVYYIGETHVIITLDMDGREICGGGRHKAK